MLPDLCLLPHEVGDLASDEPLCAPATMRVRVGRWRSASFYGARWIRLANGKFDLVARREAPDAPLLRFAFGRVDNAPRDKPDLAKLIGRCDFARCLFFGAGQKLMENRGNWQGELILSSNGESCWRAPDGEIAPFRWRNLKPNQALPREWRTRANDAQIEAAVRAMLHDETSDCAFGWRWLSWNPRQRQRVWARAERGDLDGCEQLLRAIVRCDDRWQTGSARDLVFDLGALRQPFAPGDALDGRLYDGSAVHEFCAAQNRLLALVFERFGLRLNQPMETYAAARHYSHRFGYVWRVPVAFPSQHERLEALMDVRAWLRDKVAAPELAELMEELDVT